MKNKNEANKFSLRKLNVLFLILIIFGVCRCEDEDEIGIICIKSYLKNISLNEAQLKFDHKKFKYNVEIEECIESIDLTLDIPHWRDASSEHIEYNAKGNFFSRLFKSQRNGIVFNNNDNINVTINKDPLYKTSDPTVKLPLKCGSNNLFVIKIVVRDKFEAFSFQYKINIKILTTTMVNHLISLQAFSGTTKLDCEPSLSRKVFEYSYYIFPLMSNKIKIITKCKYGTARINSTKANEFSFSMRDVNKTLEVLCPNLAVKRFGSTYKVYFVHSLDGPVPPPISIKSVYSQEKCQVDNSDNVVKILCSENFPNNTKLLFETDSRYKYEIIQKNKDSEESEEILNGKPTSVINLKAVTEIRGTAGKSITKYNFQKAVGHPYMGRFYKGLIYFLVLISKWIIISTNLFQTFLEHRFGMAFHMSPIIGPFLLILSENICSISTHNDSDMVDYCNSFSLLKIHNKNSNFTLSRPLFHNILIMTMIYHLTLKGNSKIVQKIKHYIPPSLIVDSLGFKFCFYFLYILSVRFLHFKYFQMLFSKNSRFNIFNNEKRLGFSGILSIMPSMILIATVLTSFTKYLLNDFKKTVLKIKNREVVWVVDDSNPDQKDSWLTKLLSKLNINKHNGYWSDKNCNVLCAPFTDCKLGKSVPFLKNKSSRKIATIKNINIKFELSNDYELTNYVLPELIELDTNKIDDVIKLNDPMSIFKGISSIAYTESNDLVFGNLEGLSEISSKKETYVEIQSLETTNQDLNSLIVGKVQNDDITYYIDLNVLRNTENKIIDKFLPLKVSVDQIMSSDMINSHSFNRNVRLLMIDKFIFIFKGINALFFIFSMRHNSPTLNLIRTILNILFTLYFIGINSHILFQLIKFIIFIQLLNFKTIFYSAARPYLNIYDNVFGSLCLALGTLYIFKFGYYEFIKKPRSTGVIDKLIIVSIIIIVIYSLLYSILYSIDLILSLKQTKSNEEYKSNIDIILYIKELRLSERISGYCEIPVMIGTICLYEENIILRDETLDYQRPTIAVECNIICTEFFPFLSLFNSRGDCFSFSKEQFTYAILDRYLDEIYNKKSSMIIARYLLSFIICLVIYKILSLTIRNATASRYKLLDNIQLKFMLYSI
uniref:Cadherin-like beta sandwich domain containing protein, putative n=1 Tax=Theileria annulata TaxID=5874 RepID=A0A3B0MR85_THEAN